MSRRPRARFSYPDAGTNAPVEVRRAIAAFRKLSVSMRSDLPLLYWLLGSSTPAYKMDPADANYQQEARGSELCANCVFAFRHVTSSEFICSQIRGEIEPGAWCRLWAR